MEIKSAAGVESVPELKSPRELKLEKELERLMGIWGGYESVKRYVRKISKTSTKVTYLNCFGYYMAWLRGVKGIVMDPDQLVRDNLQAVYGSPPTDVASKRRHTDWLDEYVNEVMVEQGYGGQRTIVAVSVSMFYKRNDSALFGDFSVSAVPLEKRSPALLPDDIRAVIRVLPARYQLIYLLEWQSSMEISRILSLRWEDVRGAFEGEHPVKLEFTGRKKHRSAWYTYAGRDVIDRLKLEFEEQRRLLGRAPAPTGLVFPGQQGTGTNLSYTTEVLRRTALQLHRQGLVKVGDPRSWRTHALRHSFETEAAHARVPKEIRGFFEGHFNDIMWVYNHSDEVHEEDLRNEWLKVEPFVSLEVSEAELSRRVEKATEEKTRRLEAEVEELKRRTAWLDELAKDPEILEAAKRRHSQEGG